MSVVALRKESVDRNFISLTACCKRIKVALRKESVDRNGYVGVLVVLWALVALRKESVDRNLFPGCLPFCPACRSPQGERG